MPLKNTVAAERRMDLASLFCMIGRHGPAVALAVITMVSVLAGFIIYRTVRGKRRKAAAAAAAAAVGDGRTGASAEESYSSVESTDVSDEGSSDVKEDDDVIPSDFIVRHRPAAAVAAAAAAAEKKPPPCSPLNPDIQAPENKQQLPSDATGEKKVVLEVTETYAEEAKQGLPSDTSTMAEMEVEHAVDCHQGAAGGISKDVEELRDNDSCLKEPELINDENHKEGEEVLKAECQEEEDVTTDKDVCSFNNPMETSSESNSEESVIHIEDVPAPSIRHGKSEEENPDSIDSTSYSNNNRLSPEEENENDGEMVEKECVGDQLITQVAEISSSTFEQEPKLTSTHQDQGYQVTDKAMPASQDSVWDEDDSLDGEVIDKVVDGDRLNTLTAGEFGTHSPQSNKREEEIEQKEESCLECSQEDGGLYDGADQVNEKILTTDSNSQECDGLSVSVKLPCLSEPMKVDIHEDSLSDDAEAQISSIADFPDLSVGCQSQIEDKTAPPLDEDTDSTVLGPQIPSHETEVLPESNRNGSTMVLTEECDNQVNDPQVQSCYEDQKSFQMINNEDFDKVTVAPYPDTASVIVEETCCHSPSVCEDQRNDDMESDETGVSSATDAVNCNHASLSAPLMSEDLSQPDSQDQQSNLIENNQEFSEVTSSAAPVLSKDISPPMCQIYLPSFEQSEQRDNDISSPDVGEESGISSLAVSPDLQDASKEFGVAVRNMVVPAIDCDQPSEGQTEAQNILFADDVASSVINEDTAGMVFGPYPSLCFRTPHSEHTDWNVFESFAANQDMFGHEIEDGYHRVMDQFTAQISASVTHFTDDLTIQTGMKAVIEVIEIKEEKAGGSVKQKEDTKAEEKEEDYEKTEISIMEATMDYNEWITESNYQVLPWLSFSAPTFGQDHTETSQLPSEICQDSPPSTEVKQTSTLSLVDENTENNKKVVAVQPMHQNVNVTFRVHYFTQSPYQTVAVTGNQQELGNWKGFIPLERAKDGHWATVISLPAESRLEWKFVLLDKGEVCRWEECGNRLLDTGYGDDLLVHKWWGLLEDV